MYVAAVGKALAPLGAPRNGDPTFNLCQKH